MGKDGKHLHFKYTEEKIDIIDEICEYCEKHSKSTTKEAVHFSWGKINGCNNEREDLIDAFLKTAFHTGIMYGIEHKDEIEVTEHLDVECKEKELHYDNKIYA